MNNNRPRWNEEIRKELSEIVGKMIHEWCNGETDLEDCIEDAYDVLKWRYDLDNAYELAKDLEHKHYSPDAQLVELLDGVYSEYNDIVKAHIKRWVEESNIKPIHSIGEKVSVKISGNTVDGEIVKIYDDKAQYGICVESLGQKKGESWYLIDFEDVFSSGLNDERSVATEDDSSTAAGNIKNKAK